METKKVSSKTFLEEELKSIDMTEVDEYPTFEACDWSQEKNERYQCFQEKLASNFYEQLQTKTMIFDKKIHDTIWLHLSVSEQGILQVESAQISQVINRNVPELETWLSQSLDSLPQVHPAIKRGIPVKTTFKMPVIIEVD